MLLPKSKRIKYFDDFATAFMNKFGQDSPEFDLLMSTFVMKCTETGTDPATHCSHYAWWSTLRYLRNEGYQETVDVNLHLCPDAPCYFKKMPGDEYMVFVNASYKRKKRVGVFDPYIITFFEKPKKNFGRSIPKMENHLMLDFQLRRDRKVIEAYFED